MKGVFFMDSRKILVASCAAVAFVSLAFAAYKDYDARSANLYSQILKFENSLMANEIGSLQTSPSYNDGYRDALIKMGGPQSPGSFQDGWDSALKVAGAASYADGYHTARKQFNFTKEGHARWMVSEPVAITPEANNDPKTKK